MSRLEQRIRKVEASIALTKPLVTHEELYVAGLGLALKISRLGQSSEITEWSEELVNTFKNQIIETVGKHREEEFKRDLADRVQPDWIRQRGRERFLLPVYGTAYDDWNVPNLYDRRVAIRHVPLVVDLIGPPEEDLGTPKYIIRWNEVFEATRQRVEKRMGRPFNPAWHV